MPKRPASSKRQDKGSSSGKPPSKEVVPAENVEILRSLGVDPAGAPEEVRARVATLTMSISGSPYPSGEILDDYYRRGLPQVAERILSTIDGQRAHRQRLEEANAAEGHRRLRYAQRSASALGMTSIIGALVGAHFGVPTAVCVIVAVVGVGGPNAATILAPIIKRLT